MNENNNSLRFTVYGNCQSGSVAHSLSKSKIFSSLYSYKPITPVHVVRVGDEEQIEKAFQEIDLIIQQPIADSYKNQKLCTTSLMQLRKKSSLSLFFPTLYFNAYFPHIDNLPNREKSVLDTIHDYIVIFGYLKGMTKQEIIDLMLNRHFYPKDMSRHLYNASIETLKEREMGLDIQITKFIKNNFREIKLFSTFNHPKGMVFDYVANVVLGKLCMEKLDLESGSKTALDNLVDVPVYRSTYENLQMTFTEEFQTYRVGGSEKSIDEVVESLFKTYVNIDNDYLFEAVKQKKPFVKKLFKIHGI